MSVQGSSTGSEPWDDEHEVGPIVLGAPQPLRPVERPAFDRDTDPIVIPETAPKLVEPAPAVEINAPTPMPVHRRRGGLVGGALAGAALGLAIGAFAALRGLVHTPAPPASVAQPSPPVLAQSVSPAPMAAQPAPETPQVAAVASPTSETPAPKRGLDLERLASLLGARPPEPALNTAPSASPPPPPPAPPVATVEAPRLPPPIVVARADPPPAPRPIEIPTPTPARAASKGPAPASSSVCASGSAADQVVCADPSLAVAESRLGLAYDRAMASAPDRAALHAEQQAWRAARERLAGDRNALLAAYQARIELLTEQDRRERRLGGVKRLLR